MTITNALRFTGISIATLLCGTQFVIADSHMADDRISDVVNTKHNFSAIANPELPTNDKGIQVKAATQKEVCVFCHTPHGDPINEPGKAFLWNHKASSQTYTNYSSSSMDATIGDPGEASKMCLSCHDGTVAVGAVDVFNGKLASDQTPSSIEMSGDGQSAGLIVDTGTGYNSNLGFDLTNDHPVGFAYTATVATNDGELINPESVDYIGPRQNRLVTNWNNAINETNDLPSTRKAVPLEASLTTALSSLSAGTLATFGGGTVECTTCHDPHIRSTTNDHNIKFLRLNRFQEGSPSGGSFSINQDINCLACHKKAGWSTSAHGSITHADEIYDDTAADDREFPRGIKVSEASCLNCHDAHTEEGARYLLREGADDVSGDSAIEETCYQCHSTNSILTDVNQAAKDIKSVYSFDGGHALSDFGTSNTHDIKNSDLKEDALRLGGGNRHVTCTDCHNPHRMLKNAVYDDSSGKVQATHDHDGNSVHSNSASGAIAGTFGVEPPVYPANFRPFASLGVYDEKKGMPSTVADKSTEETQTFVTKEYQVCLKCHSDHSQVNISAATAVSNVAAEFNYTDIVSGNNHNSWHPVVRKTNRLNGQNALETPWNDAGAGNAYAGAQTMYCSDCHTNNDIAGNLGQGPHGSNFTGGNKMLVGAWTATSGDTQTDLCFSCHKYEQYGDPTTAVLDSSGFSCAVAADCKQGDYGTNSIYTSNLHIAHANKDVNYACSQCHVKVPHGWYNKALLVDVSDDISLKILGDDSVADATLEAKYYFGNAALDMNYVPASGQWIRSATAPSAANGSTRDDDCDSSGCHN